MNAEFNFLNKINKRIEAIINFAGTSSNPLLTAYTQSLRELNIKYKWDKNSQTIKMSLGKENQAKADALKKKLEENHATTYRDYVKNFKQRVENEREEPLTHDELMHELEAQVSLWSLNDNFQVFYSFTRSGATLPPELEPYAHYIDEFRGSDNNRRLREDPERLKDIAIKLDKAVSEYRKNNRARAMNDIRQGRAL